MNRVDLSADTRIEDMGGVRCLVTDDDRVAIQWPRYALQYRWDVIRDAWFGSPIFKMGAPEYRIPLTAVAPVYEYVEGEPWVGIPITPDVECSIGVGVTLPWDNALRIHRRAAIVCDGAEQFRLFHEELKEARDHAE